MVMKQATPYVEQAREAANDALAPYEPLQIALVAVAATVLLLFTLQSGLARWRRLRSRGVLQSVFNALRSLPIIRGYVKKEKDKMRKDLHSKFLATADDRIVQLPAQGQAPSAVVEKLRQKVTLVHPHNCTTPLKRAMMRCSAVAVLRCRAALPLIPQAVAL